jgi:Asp-tRNA(Asn)/Glu-tRNA(Gln) amidotransferase A subunit family amidase
VAVATGMAPLGLGSDLGGSLRVPALACGVAALRPTPGRVPFAGATSRPPSMTQQLFAVPGPIGRDVADLHAALATLTGPHPADPWSLPVPLEDPAAPPARRRVAVTMDSGGGGVDPIVAEGVRRAAEALDRFGWQVQQADPPDVEAAAQVWMRLLGTEIAAAGPSSWPTTSSSSARSRPSPSRQWDTTSAAPTALVGSGTACGWWSRSTRWGCPRWPSPSAATSGTGCRWVSSSSPAASRNCMPWPPPVTSKPPTLP